MIDQATDTVSTELSKEDIRALRAATSVHARRIDGASQLEAHLESPLDDTWTDSSAARRRTIPCRERLTIYRRNGTERYGDSYPDVTAFAYSIGGSYDLPWRTIVSLLRAGDEIELHWIAGNSSGYLDAAHGKCADSEVEFHGLCRDELDLTVYRSGKQRYSFHVDTCVCPDNSARTIRGT